MADLTQIEREAWASLRPPAKIRLSKWVEKNVVLTASIAAAPGLMRLFPYQREMADSMGNPAVERVSVLKSARIGYSQLLTALMAHHVVNDPASVLAVLPTDSDAKYLMTSVIEPTFAASPSLASALEADTRGRDTMLSRHYPGGTLALIPASTPRALRARTARVILMDELDAWELDARGEGDPVTLAEKRAFTFADRKIVAGSTPVDEDTSHILRMYNRSDMRVWECSCQHCGEYHPLEWKDIRWQPDRPETAAWACPSCGSFTEDREKAPMLTAGRWRATRPEVRGHHGYKINALASLLPNAAWPLLAAEFVEAKRGGPVTLKPWVNTVLGEAWRGEGDDLDPAALAKLQRPHNLESIPPEIVCLTAGADIQGDRIELSTCGWDRDGNCRVLAHEIVWGEPLEDATWRELDGLLTRRFKHPNGGELRVDAAVIDSGNWSDAVYAFCRPRTSRRVIAGKGMPGMGKPYLAWGASRQTRLALIGTEAIKLHLHQRLGSGETVTFSDELGPDYLDQIAAEKLVTKYRRGHPVRQWDKISGRRNEALDTLVYATAARRLVALNFDAREAELASAGAPKKAPAVVRSSWLNG